MDEFLAKGRMVGAKLSVQAQPSEDKSHEQKEKEQEEQVKQEQVEEEKIEKQRQEKIEPDVTPQKDEGVDRPIAS